MNRIVKAKLEEKLDTKIILEIPKNTDFGDYATPLAFSLAKELRKSPKIIANDLVQKLADIDIFSEVSAIDGFVNVKLRTKFLDSIATDTLNNPQDFGRNTTQRSSILLEYVSANPTGPLHIGHARGAILGDVLARLGNYIGYQVFQEYYINDSGSQINLLGASLYYTGREHCLKLEVEYPQEYYRGEYIVDLAKEAYKVFGEKAFLDESHITELAEFGKNLMLEEIKSNLAEVNIKHDLFSSEKAIYTKESWEKTLEILKSNDGIKTEDGKIWLLSTKHKDEKDRVIIKDNGEATYLAGDIVYHLDKFKRGFDICINIWGADHHGYIARIKSSLEFLGYDSNKLEVILSQMVALLKNGQPYKMSKRAGNFILMKDLVQEMGNDALRFVFLSKKSDTHLEFDIDEFKKEDSSNPIFYIQYAHARICTLLEKSNIDRNTIINTRINDGIDENARKLLVLALQLPYLFENAFESRQMQKITDYLKQISGDLHSFYNAKHIIGDKNEQSYLKILLLVALSIKTALFILGIEAKNSMFQEIAK